MTAPLNDLNTVSALLKSGYAKAAVAAYRAHKQATDPSWLEGKGSRWGRAATAEALVWWIQHEVKLGSDDRITGRDGKSYPRYPVSERLAEHVVMLQRQWADHAGDRRATGLLCGHGASHPQALKTRPATLCPQPCKRGQRPRARQPARSGDCESVFTG